MIFFPLKNVGPGGLIGMLDMLVYLIIRIVLLAVGNKSQTHTYQSVFWFNIFIGFLVQESLVGEETFVQTNVQTARSYSNHTRADV